VGQAWAAERIPTGTLAGLERLLAGTKPPHVLASDLSLGAWQSNHVASELCAQLGIELPPSGRTIDGTLESRATADVIGELVDREMAGDLMAMRAAALAEIVGEAMTPDMLIAIVAPQFELTWEEPDIRFVEQLAAVLQIRQARLMLIVPSDTDGAPTKGLRMLVPGIVSPDVAAAIDAREAPSEVRSLMLENGFELIAPECRRRPDELSEARFAELAVIAKGCDAPSLSAYAQCHGYKLFADAAWLRKEAVRLSAEGSANLALRLAERAANCGRGPEDSLAGESLVQGMRIASQRFEETAAQDAPSPDAPAAQRAFLLEAKGWGLTMIGESREAERYLSEARALTDVELGDERERLYLLNISALNRLRLGDPEGALVMEREIEERHALLARRDWRLEYLNALNTARLLRKLSRLEEALQYFERAFATTLGVRSPSDSVYINITRARIADEVGQVAAAFEGLVRSSAHWLALEVPESLAPRAMRTVTKQSTRPGVDRVEEVSAAMLGVLLDLAPWARREELERAARGLDGEPPSFAYAHDLPATAEVGWGAMGSGLGVLTAVGAARRALETDSPSRVALRAAVWAVLGPVCSVPEGSVVVIDDRLGCELPTTDLELLESSLRLHGCGLTQGNRRVQLDRALRSRLGESLQVTLGNAVDRVDRRVESALVIFKRRLAPTMLTVPELELVSLVEDEPTVGQLRERVATPDLCATLRGLELRRVVRLRATIQSGTVAGLDPRAGSTPGPAGRRAR
jgi:tetratricopeptide (TPR) repeat protein